MVEALSLVGSIWTLIKISRAVVDNIRDFKDAPAARSKLRSELRATESLLEDLTSLIEDDTEPQTWLTAVHRLNEYGGLLDQYKAALQKLATKLQEKPRIKAVGARLAWTFVKDDVAGVLAHCERLKSFCEAAMTRDLLAVSSLIKQDLKTIDATTRRVELNQRGHSVQIDNISDNLANFQLDEKWHRICTWLAAPDPSTNFSEGLRKRQPMTGQWLINSDAYTEWKARPGQLFHLFGKPGCGKSVLCATIVEDTMKLKDTSKTAVAYFYFDFNDKQKQDFGKCLCSLISQLSMQLAQAPGSLLDVYGQCQNGQHQASPEQLAAVLLQICRSFEDIYLILDALDECPDREDLLEWIASLTTTYSTSLRIVVLSRKERDIDDALRGVPGRKLTIEDAKVDDDIRVYVKARLASDLKHKKWDETLQKLIEQVLMEKANGM